MEQVLEPAAFQDWYWVERDRLLTSMALLFGEAETAHAVAREAFSRVSRRWDRVDATANPRRRLYAAALRRVRATRKRRGLLRRANAQTRWHTVIPPEYFEVWHGVRRLDPEVRVVVVFRRVAGLSEADVARLLRVPVIAIDATLWVGLRELEAKQPQPHRDSIEDQLCHLGELPALVPEVPGVVSEDARARRSRRRTLVAMVLLLATAVGIPFGLVLHSGVLGISLLL
jgi:DNA-directed RNA polymerase specialized sigma24 family protein